MGVVADGLPRPARAVPGERLAAPSGRPAVPRGRSAVFRGRPAASGGSPAVPSGRPAVPSGRQTGLRLACHRHRRLGQPCRDAGRRVRPASACLDPHLRPLPIPRHRRPPRTQPRRPPAHLTRRRRRPRPIRHRCRRAQGRRSDAPEAGGPAEPVYAALEASAVGPDELDPVAPRVGAVEPARAGDRVVPLH